MKREFYHTVYRPCFKLILPAPHLSHLACLGHYHGDALLLNSQAQRVSMLYTVVTYTSLTQSVTFSLPHWLSYRTVNRIPSWIRNHGKHHDNVIALLNRWDVFTYNCTSAGRILKDFHMNNLLCTSIWLGEKKQYVVEKASCCTQSA